MRRLVITMLVTSLGFSGCASWQTEETVIPVSYTVSRERIPRTVGKLRRLALIALYQPAPKICNGSGERPALSPEQWYAGSALAYLQDKGYEVLPLEAAIDEPTRNILLNPDFLARLGEWSTQTQGNSPLDPNLREAISILGKKNNFDGFLILQIEETCTLANKAFRTSLGIMSLGVSELLRDPKLQQIHSGLWATIVEVSGAHPVWRSHVFPELLDWWQGGPFASERKSVMDTLFEDLEPATPKILTR